ncbi:MAG: betaine--homocysteine S-methyltransferase [Anaerolineales bacterium]|jgi:methionine synthase I (cobalamin-dependent)
MTEDIATWLEEQPWIMLDGAMGSLLIAAGIPQGTASELWNAERPDEIAAIYQAYIDAGAQIFLTNSFGGSRFRLAKHDLGDRVTELNQAAAEIARKVLGKADHPVYVAGSMGPSGELMQPLGPLTPEEAREGFAEQARALAEGGVDLLWVETMSDLAEVQSALEGIQSAVDLPFAVTMTFESRGRTMMGVTPEAALETLLPYGPIAIGANCGNGPAEIEGVIEHMAATNPPVPLIAKSNAGMPRLDGDQIVYDATPEVMAEHAVRVRDLGARLIGGCCGSTPEHIVAMHAGLSSA